MRNSVDIKSILVVVVSIVGTVIFLNLSLNTNNKTTENPVLGSTSIGEIVSTDTQKNFEGVSTKVEVAENFSKLIKLIEEIKGNYSLYIKDLYTQEEYSYNPDREYYSASLFKLPLAAAILKDIEKGKLNFDYEIELKEDDIADGSGVINKQPVGSVYSVENLFKHLLKDSDNTAQNMLMSIVSFDSYKQAYDLCSDDYMETSITSPKIYSKFLETLYIEPYLNKDHKEYLIKTMSKTSFDNRISEFLEEGLIFSHKIGTWAGSYHDCGYVFGDGTVYTVCLMSDNTTLTDFITMGKGTAEFINSLQATK